MNAKTIKKRKLSTTLAIYSIIVLLILNTITAIFMGVYTSNAMNQKQTAYLTQILTNAKNEIDDFIEKYTAVAQTIANTTSLKNAVAASNAQLPMSSVPSFANTVQFIQQTQQTYDDILNISVGSVAENTIYITDGTMIDYSLKDRPTFDAVTENKIIVTEPYIDAITNSLCISISAPIQNNGQTQGLVCVDLKLDNLSNFLKGLSFGETGNIILIGQDNAIIAYSNTSLIGQPFSQTGASGKSLEAELSAPTGKTFSYNLNGMKKTGVIIELPQYNWKVFSGISSKEYNQDAVYILSILVILLIINTIITACVLRYILIKKLRPISDIKQSLAQMSQGNLQIEIENITNDEIGEIADSIYSCTSSLSAYIHEIDVSMENLTCGNLTYSPSLTFQGDFISIQHSISKFVQKLTELNTEITTVAEQVSTGSEQVSAGAQSLANASEKQSSSIEELTLSISKITKQMQTTDAVSNACYEKVFLANSALTESIEHMQNLSEAMNRIRIDSEKISGIIKTIEDIAFQTNILALNAAVEAARAGLAGKGFAVVADEVRNLSSKSSEASQQIAELIETSGSSIQDGAKATQETKKALGRVEEQAVQIVEIIDRIAHASSQQADAITQINESMEQISSTVHSNSATAEQSAASSQELTAQASILKALLAQFKTEKETTPKSESFYDPLFETTNDTQEKY